MTTQKYLSSRHQLYMVGAVTLAVWALLAWEYTHGGVPRHYLLHREDLPSFSNWWGAITIPLTTCFLLGRISKFINNHPENTKKRATDSLFLFLGGLLFTITLSIIFTISPEANLLAYIPIGVLFLAFFFPLYRASFMLGFVLGLVYSFGGVLPLIIGLLYWLLFFIAYKGIRRGVLYVFRKIN